MGSVGDALVIGLGNPILSDDGIGWRVAQHLRAALEGNRDLNPIDGVDIREAAVGGLSLVEMMVGYDRVVVIDAIVTRQSVPGTVTCLTLSDLPGSLNSASAHDTNVLTALHALRRFGANVPQSDMISVVAVEASDVLTFAERCTPAVESAIPLAVSVVLECLRRVAVN